MSPRPLSEPEELTPGPAGVDAVPNGHADPLLSDPHSVGSPPAEPGLTSPGAPAGLWWGRCLGRARLGISGVDAAALVGFALCAVLLFRLQLFEGWTFVGDSDRLNTDLNVRLFEVRWLHAAGRVPTWSEEQFMGYGIVGLHWMLPGLTPIPYLLARLPVSQVFDALDFLSVVLLALAMMSAYWALGAYATGPIPRMVGALLYGLASYTVHKLTQLDLSFSALVLAPLLLLLVRETRRETAPWAFLGLAAAWAWLTLLTVLQEIAYIALLFGTYALFRSIRRREWWPLLVAGLAFGCGVTIGLPRVLTIALDAPLLSRTTSNVDTAAVEALRYFGDGLLGRAQGEQNVLRGPTVNLHEGVQLLRSSLAALAVIAGGLLARSWVLRLWTVGLVVVLSVALNAYFRPFYELDALGLKGATFPSRELRTVLVNAVLIGLPVWLLSWWLARPRGAGQGARGERRGARGERREARDEGQGARDETPAAVQDAPFFLGFVVLALAAILIAEARVVLYYGFLRMDFLHSRISVAMTLPLAALAAIFLGRFLPARLGPAARRWLAGGLVLGVGVWLAREVVAEVVAAQVGPAVDALRPRRLLTVEVVRVLGSLLIVLAAAVLLARRAAPSWLTLGGGLLATVIVLESVDGAAFMLTGPQTRVQDRPFESLNYLNTAPGAFRPPTDAERAAVRERLEVEQYRAVILQDRDRFPAMIEPHLASFWGLRLVEGYSTGLPRRLGALPWTDSMYSVRHFDIHAIHSIERMPWRLLAALNVKYLVIPDRSFWFNPAPGGADPPLDLGRLQVIENPRPVTPRVFFTARVSPAGDAPRIPGDAGRRPPPVDPPIESPTSHVVVEGIAAERQFSTAGTPSATFEGDRVLVRVDPAAEDRFLVLNEMYHPAWRAWVDGQPVPIYPADLVMRGILVPAGATTVELRYQPFLLSGSGLGLMLAGAVLTGLGWWAVRRVSRGRRPTGWPGGRASE